MADLTNASEQHPYFPSGIWEGFYVYGSGPSAHRHSMSFSLDFKDGKVSGSGSDDVGALTWNGSYDVQSMAVSMVKQYHSHTVGYRGMADTSGIYGSWEMFSGRGGFHIWPKKTGEEAEEAAAEEEEVLVNAKDIPTGFCLLL